MFYAFFIKVTISDGPMQSQSAPPSPPPISSGSSFPPRFVYTVKPTSSRRSDTDSDIDDVQDNTEVANSVDDSTLRSRSLHSPTSTLTPSAAGTVPPVINGNRPFLTMNLLNNTRKKPKLREPPQSQQTKRLNPLRVDVAQVIFVILEPLLMLSRSNTIPSYAACSLYVALTSSVSTPWYEKKIKYRTSLLAVCLSGICCCQVTWLKGLCLLDGHQSWLRWCTGVPSRSMLLRVAFLSCLR